MHEDTEFDIVVVGAGACGLTAALAAHCADPTLRIAVLEKAHRLMGNSMLSSGSIPASGTRFQQQAGITDTNELFSRDLLAVSGEHEAMHLAQSLIDVSAEVIHWLVDVAHVNLTLVQSYKHVGHSVYRLHSPPSRRGADLTNDLMHSVQARDIPVVFNNPVRRLLTASDGQQVCGLVSQTPDGKETVVSTKAVILASNGFGANRELLKKYIPDVAPVAYGGSTGSEGEAIIWGELLGADLRNMAAYQGHASLADPHGSLVTWTVVEKGGIIIDGSGQRLGNETIGYSAFAALEITRPGPFYVLADARIRDLTAKGQQEYADLVAAGGVREFSTVQALANALGISPSVLEGTIDSVTAAAEGTRADSWGRKDWGLSPLVAPYTLTRITPALFHTQGGLNVDARARVLRADGTWVTGLYAGGGAAAGISGASGGTGYVSGNGLLAAVGLGYLAGLDSALFVASKTE
jgi:fumarate reductase flavoprotein subunit